MKGGILPTSAERAVSASLAACDAATPVTRPAKWRRHPGRLDWLITPHASSQCASHGDPGMLAQDDASVSHAAAATILSLAPYETRALAESNTVDEPGECVVLSDVV